MFGALTPVNRLIIALFEDLYDTSFFEEVSSFPWPITTAGAQLHYV